MRNRRPDLPGDLFRVRGATDHEVDVLGGFGHHRPRRLDCARYHQHGRAVGGQDPSPRTDRRAGACASRRYSRDRDADQRAATGEDRSADLRTRYRAVRQPGSSDRVDFATADDHQPQTGRAGGSDHESVPNRLGTKQFGQRYDAGDLHHRRGQQDLRPQRTGRAADGDLANPQGQQHRPEQHDRSARQSGGPPTGAGSRSARCGSPSTCSACAGSSLPRRRRSLPRPPNRRPRNACRSWKHFVQRGRSRTTSTRPSVSRSWPISSPPSGVDR